MEPQRKAAGKGGKSFGAKRIHKTTKENFEKISFIIILIKIKILCTKTIK